MMRNTEEENGVWAGNLAWGIPSARWRKTRLSAVSSLKDAAAIRMPTELKIYLDRYVYNQENSVKYSEPGACYFPFISSIFSRSLAKSRS